MKLQITRKMKDYSTPRHAIGELQNALKDLPRVNGYRQLELIKRIYEYEEDYDNYKQSIDFVAAERKGSARKSNASSKKRRSTLKTSPKSKGGNIDSPISSFNINL